MKKLLFSLLVAASLWAVMFSPLTAPHVNFWLAMSLSAVTLCLLCRPFGASMRSRIRLGPTNFGLGLLVAVGLWGAFWLGDLLATALFDFAPAQIDGIYQLKDGTSPLWLSLLLLLLIGPAEEFFWRGYVQHALASSMGRLGGFCLATALYAAVHIPSLNFVLVMASLLCGVVWGGLYYLMSHRLGALVISHAVWDAAVFVWFPI